MIDLLAMGPHPDDVELSCGGWIAAATGRGQAVAIVDLTRGELATNGTIEARTREAEAAAKALGVRLRENLALPDGGLSAENTTQRDAIVSVIRRHRPTLLLAPWIEARHPDHAAAGRLAQVAYFFAGLRKHRPDLGEPWRPTRLIHYPQRHEIRPDFVVDISAHVAIKHAAIACHLSQFGAGEPTMINRPLGLRALATRDAYWGASIGVEAGEPYLLGAPLPVADPVAHFEAHPAVPVLVPPR